MDSLVDYGYSSGEEEEIIKKNEENLTPSVSILSNNNNPYSVQSETAEANDLRGGDVSPLVIEALPETNDDKNKQANIDKCEHVSDTEMCESKNTCESEEDEQESLTFEALMKNAEQSVSPEFRERIERLRECKRRGQTIQSSIEKRNEYLNPYLLEKMMRLFEIDPYCSNFPKTVYNPAAYANTDYALLNAKQRASENRSLSQQRSRSQSEAPSTHTQDPGNMKRVRQSKWDSMRRVPSQTQTHGHRNTEVDTTSSFQARV